jgi:hypothetical protein
MQKPKMPYSRASAAWSSPRLRQPEVIEAEVGWEVGLAVAAELGPGLHNVSPLGEPLSRPAVVLRDGVGAAGSGTIGRTESFTWFFSTST